MYADISKDAVLFYKALQDIWCAEQTYVGSPSNAVWSCCQAVEKTMKGLLQCYGIDAGITHDLGLLLEDLEKETELSKQAVSGIQDLARYDQRLRYKNLKSDPTVEEAKAVVGDTVGILRELGEHPKCVAFMNEAREVYSKLLSNASDTSAKSTL